MSKTAHIVGGCIFKLKDRLQLRLYFCHQNTLPTNVLINSQDSTIDLQEQSSRDNSCEKDVIFKRNLLRPLLSLTETLTYTSHPSGTVDIQRYDGEEEENYVKRSESKEIECRWIQGKDGRRRR